jgi:hypothetical protein
MPDHAAGFSRPWHLDSGSRRQVRTAVGAGTAMTEERRSFAGPFVFICDECTDLCAEIVRQARAVPGEAEYASWAAVAATQPSPPDPIALLRAELAESTRQIISAVRIYGR